MTAEGRRRPRDPAVAEAQEAQRLLLEDIRAALRSPVVPLLARRLVAGYQAYLQRVWRDLKPNLLSRAFERRADELRAAAVRAVAATGAVAPGSYRDALHRLGLSTTVVDDITRTVAVVHYVDPKLLLLATALDLALGNEPVGGAADLTPEEREALPAGPPPAAAELAVLGDAEAPGRVLRIWNDVVATLELPGVTDDLRAIGRWPDFLELVWGAAKPLVGRPAVAEIGAMAEDGARRLPFRITVGPAAVAELGYTMAQAAELSRLTREFRRRLPALVFTAALARLGLDPEGQAHAEASPFPV